MAVTKQRESTPTALGLIGIPSVDGDVFFHRPQSTVCAEKRTAASLPPLSSTAAIIWGAAPSTFYKDHLRNAELCKILRDRQHCQNFTVSLIKRTLCSGLGDRGAQVEERLGRE